jgi:hypothetical protein
MKTKEGDRAQSHLSSLQTFNVLLPAISYFSCSFLLLKHLNPELLSQSLSNISLNTTSNKTQMLFYGPFKLHNNHSRLVTLLLPFHR